MRWSRLWKRAKRVAAGVLDAPPRTAVRRRTDLDGCPRPVLLLHGFFTTRRTFDLLERRLRRDGYGVISLDLGGWRRAFNTRGIDDLAALVRSKVERLYARHPGLGPLTIVGHSKGGVVAAYYVKKLGGWRRARQVVMLGAPWHGTPLAWLGVPAALLAPSLAQLLPGSLLLRDLHEEAWPAGVGLASIWSKRDRLARWPSPVLHPGGHPGVRNVEVDCAHLEFLTRGRVYQVIRREVEAGLAEARPALQSVQGGRPGPVDLEAARRERERARRVEPALDFPLA